MRRGARVAIIVGFLAAAFGSAAPARAQVPILHLDGRGWGHGVGLAQWGAMYAAAGGADAGTILSTFYPGTELGSAGGLVRVAVHAGPAATLAFPGGGQLQSDAPGFPVDLAPGAQVLVRPGEGGWQVDGVVVGQAGSTPVLTSASAGAPDDNCLPLLGPCTTAPNCRLGCPTVPTTAPPPTEPPPATDLPPPTDVPPPTDAPPATDPPTPPPLVTGAPLVAVPVGGGVVEVVDRGRQYRGVVHVVPDAAGLRLVNELDVETYLKGMAEVPSTWPAAAQQAQAIAARTYVLRAMAASGEVCDHERCQVYVGATREAPGQNAAVDATQGAVLTYGGALAAAVYSADAGGITATASEGFGSGADYPYLTTVHYDTPDPLPWVADVALADVAGRLGYPGTVTDVHVAATGPSGRAVQVALEGDAGEQVVDGRTFARNLGLRSTLFTASTGSAATAPPPPPLPDGEEAMALPDDARALTAAIAETAARAHKKPTTVWADSANVVTSLNATSGDTLTTPAAVAVAALASATALAVLQAGGPEALLGAAVSSWRPRPARSSSRAGRRRGPRRGPR